MFGIPSQPDKYFKRDASFFNWEKRIFLFFSTLIATKDLVFLFCPWYTSPNAPFPNFLLTNILNFDPKFNSFWFSVVIFFAFEDYLLFFFNEWVIFY